MYGLRLPANTFMWELYMREDELHLEWDANLWVLPLTSHINTDFKLLIWVFSSDVFFFFFVSVCVLKRYLHCPSNHGPEKCLPQHTVIPSQRPWEVCHCKKTTSSQATTVAPFQKVVSWCSQHFKAVYRPLYHLWKRQSHNAWWTMWEKCWL